MNSVLGSKMGTDFRDPKMEELALTLPTCGGRSVGIVLSRTQATEFVLCLFEDGRDVLFQAVLTDKHSTKKLMSTDRLFKGGKFRAMTDSIAK
jgi:hypothetical protein